MEAGGVPEIFILPMAASAPKLRFFTTSWAAASAFTRRVPSGSRQNFRGLNLCLEDISLRSSMFTILAPGVRGRWR